MEKRPNWRRFLDAVDAEGWRLVVLTRFVSPLPGGAINYLFGLTGIAFVPYVVATAARAAFRLSRHSSSSACWDAWRSRTPSRHPATAAISAVSLLVIALTAMLIVRRMRAVPKAMP